MFVKSSRTQRNRDFYHSTDCYLHIGRVSFKIFRNPIEKLHSLLREVNTLTTAFKNLATAVLNGRRLLHVTFQLSDIGANLTDLMYAGIYNGSKKHQEDLQNVLKRSWEAGLDKIIITGGNLEESKKALKIAESDERLFSTVGCHPTRCSEFEENPNYLNELKQVIEEGGKKVVAIGECGLDYDRVQFCPIEIQKKYFERQLELCKLFKLPLFLHCRKAASDLADILSKHSGLKGVVHSFDGTIQEATRFIDMNFLIGLNGCSLKTKENLETVKALPKNKILIETDCPWCEIRPTHAGYGFISKDNLLTSVKKEKWNPENMVKGRNEPNNIRQVLDVISKVRNEDQDSLCEAIYQNTMQLFFT